MAPVMTRALTCYLAATLSLAACKSDDKPKEPAKTPSTPAAEKAPPAEKAPELPGEAKDTAAATVDQALAKASAAVDKARVAIDLAKVKAMTATEMARAAADLAAGRAVEAISDLETLRGLMTLVDGQFARAMEDVTAAPSEDARKAATATLEKLKVEKEKLKARLDALEGAAKP